MKDRITPKTPKGKRLSLVALAGAVLTLGWAMLEWAGVDVPDGVISGTTGLAMLIAGSFEVAK